MPKNVWGYYSPSIIFTSSVTSCYLSIPCCCACVFVNNKAGASSVIVLQGSFCNEGHRLNFLSKKVAFPFHVPKILSTFAVDEEWTIGCSACS